MPNATDIDVIVGGAGVAGTAAAAAIQRLGYSVLLVEPGQNDDRRLAGEVFHPPGVSGLAELGLLNALMDEPAVTVNGFTVTSGKEYIRLPYDSVLTHQMPGLCLEHRLIRRRLLDRVGALPNVTVKHGARVVHIDQSHSSGLVVRLAEGRNAQQDYRCRMLVAADGAQSRIGRMAGITVHSRRISTILSYRVGAESLPQRDYGHVFLGGGTPILLYPIAADEARILFDIPYDSGRRPDDSDCLAMAAAALPPVLRRAVEDAVGAQPKVTVLTHASATDRSVAGRVALVGDAGGSCHPLTASGMTMCINDALLLRRALIERPDRLPEALAFYQQRRRWPQATRLALAEALRDAFCGTSPELRVVQNGILAYWRDNAAGRAATLALLSTADGRPLALLRQFAAVMIRGFIEHLYERRDGRAGTLRLAGALFAALARQIRQMGLIPAGAKFNGGKWPRLRRQRG
jgi:2-polyprenyl-6-methoxyphenol hydroxylase-like FAD-dependent oxidoreductase